LTRHRLTVLLSHTQIALASKIEHNQARTDTKIEALSNTTVKSVQLLEQRITQQNEQLAKMIQNALDQNSGQARQPSQQNTGTSMFAALLWTLGFKGVLVKSQSVTRHTISICLRFKIPGIGFLPRIITTSFIIRTFWPGGILLPTSSLVVARLVPEKAQIMLACAKGDLKMTKTLFDMGEASAYDVTPLNRTPLEVNKQLFAEKRES
jgi:hypothetical protein